MAATADLVHRFYDDLWNRWDDSLVGATAAARLTYTGTHTDPLLGIPATGRPFEYAGAAFFTVADGLLTSAWVLGDLAALRQQLSSGG